MNRWVGIMMKNSFRRVSNSIPTIFCLILIIKMMPFLLSSMRITVLLRDGITFLTLGEANAAAKQFVQAVEIMPKNVVSNRLIARNAIENNQASVAVTHLKRALEARPKDWLLQNELAQAYDLTGNFNLATQLWSGLNESVEQMVIWGDAYASRGQYLYAFRTYKRAIEVTKFKRPDLLFRGVGLSVLAKQDTEAYSLLDVLQEFDPELKIFQLDNNLIINGIEFRFMDGFSMKNPPGRKLDEYPNSKIGGFHNKGVAIAFVSVDTAGNYQISASLLHHRPPPIEMAIEIDDKRLLNVDLDLGDGKTWEVVQTSVELTTGLHLVRVWFLNDGAVNGLSRHAALKWVKFQKKT